MRHSARLEAIGSIVWNKKTKSLGVESPEKNMELRDWYVWEFGK